MADSKITALTSISTSTDPANDPLVIVDVSDTSMAATGTTKKVTLNQLLGASGTATLASATITGDLTVDTSTLKVDSANDRVGVGTATPSQKLEVATASSDTRVRINSTSVVCTEYFRSGTGLWLVGSDSTNAFKIARGSNFGGSADYFSIAAATADATWYDGAGGTRMTLNATGLGVGVVPANDKLLVSQTIGLVTSTTSDVNFRNIGNTTIQRIRYDDSTGGLTIGSALGTAYPVQIGGNTTTRAVIIDGSSNVGIGVTPAGTGGCLQLKSGITFPATQVASSDANTLDDYEEGTWTGTIGGTTGNPTTPVTSTGRYTKIGRQVYVEIGFYGDTTGASGRITVSGLPFTSNAIIARPGTILMDTMGTFTGSLAALLGSGVTSVDLYASNSNGAISSVTHNTGAGRALYMELTYTV